MVGTNDPKVFFGIIIAQSTASLVPFPLFHLAGPHEILYMFDEAFRYGVP